MKTKIIRKSFAIVFAFILTLTIILFAFVPKAVSADENEQLIGEFTTSRGTLTDNTYNSFSYTTDETLSPSYVYYTEFELIAGKYYLNFDYSASVDVNIQYIVNGSQIENTALVNDNSTHTYNDTTGILLEDVGTIKIQFQVTNVISGSISVNNFNLYGTPQNTELNYLYNSNWMSTDPYTDFTENNYNALIWSQNTTTSYGFISLESDLLLPAGSFIFNFNYTHTFASGIVINLILTKNPYGTSPEQIKSVYNLSATSSPLTFEYSFSVDTDSIVSLSVQISYNNSTLAQKNASFTNISITDGVTLDNDYSKGFYEGYVFIYKNAFLNGQKDSPAIDEAYKNGYTEGEESGRANGYNEGYNKGYAQATSDNESLWGYIKAIGEVPFIFVGSWLNFELMGVNMRDFVTAILSTCLVIAVVKLLI